MRETLRAAFVIGRRDFTAIIFSKAFFFFLLGPLFPLVVALVAGNLGKEIAESREAPVIGMMMDIQSAEKLNLARTTLSKQMGQTYFAEMKLVDVADYSDLPKPEKLLVSGKDNYAAILSGTLEKPVLTGTVNRLRSLKGDIALLSAYASSNQAAQLPQVKTNTVESSANRLRDLRQATGQAGMVVLFMLTTLLAGMVLSNLVEEKSNKIIEILAASIPMDSVFIGKIFAMLVMAFVGIIVWTTMAYIGLTIWGDGIPDLPTPAVGWPVFLILGIIYFSMSYLMLASLFLGIGAMAATVREVQTLSMPATMLQMVVFFVAIFGANKLDEPIEIFASIFPFSSPLAMLSRAAQVDILWHHGVAIIGQAFFALLILRIGVTMFRRNVMKSGAGNKKKRKLFGLLTAK